MTSRAVLMASLAASAVLIAAIGIRADKQLTEEALDCTSNNDRWVMGPDEPQCVRSAGPVGDTPQMAAQRP
jgi:hypothetical protein